MIVPLEGDSNPVIIFRSVDFPAPFGPSRAVMPGPMPNVTSDTATTSPYHFETWSTMIVGLRPAMMPGSIPARSSKGTIVSVIGQIPPCHDPERGRDRRQYANEVLPEREIAVIAEFSLIDNHAEQRRRHPIDRANRAEKGEEPGPFAIDHDGQSQRQRGGYQEAHDRNGNRNQLAAGE